MSGVWIELMESFQGDEIMLTATKGDKVIRRRLLKSLVDDDPELVRRTADSMAQELRNPYEQMA